MTYDVFMGIDAGADGAIVVADNNEWEVFRLKDASEHDIAEHLRFWAGAPIFAVIERLQATPSFVGGDGERKFSSGSVASFKKGSSYGFLRGCLVMAKIPFDQVTPRVWQREMGCLSGGDKNITKARAQQLFPNAKVIHATADALLIAEFCRRKHGGRNAEGSSVA